MAAWGAHPGLRPGPWTLDGVLAALSDAGLRGDGLMLGNVAPTDRQAMRLASAGFSPPPEEGTVPLRPAGTRRPVRVPRTWLGRNLCLVIPCVHRSPAKGSAEAWTGPIGAALDQLAQHWGGPLPRDPLGSGARLLSEIFAHTTVIIDGSWWAPLGSNDAAAPLLLAPERVLGLRLPSPVTDPTALDPRPVDAWLGAQIGLPGRRPSPPPRVEGSAARTPWPRIPRVAPRSTGLAGQAVGALWRRTDRPKSRKTALPPAVPGSLARLWDEYEAPR